METKDTILIISEGRDPDTRIVAERLSEIGASYVRFDSDEFAAGKIFVTLESPGEAFLHIRTEKVSLNRIRSVWVRKPQPLALPIDDPVQRAFAERELQELMNQLYSLLPNALWVNRRDVAVRGSRKYSQLLLANKLGFKTPKTCVTNSPSDARTFIESCEGRVIYKTLSVSYMRADYSSRYITDPEERVYTLPTSIIHKDKLDFLSLLSRTGGIFQEYIQKEYELRITVMGEKVFAAKLDSQKNENEAGKIDWREGEFTRLNADPYRLPADIEKKCLQFVIESGLVFGAIDVIKTPSGEYVFLELNTNGQWVWLDECTNEPYIDTFVHLLSTKD